MADVDISLTWSKEVPPDTLKRLSGFHVRVANGLTQVSTRNSTQSAPAETGAVEFVEALESTTPELFDLDSELEMAFYYDVSEHAYFSTRLSAEFMLFAGERKMGLKIIGYPCSEE